MSQFENILDYFVLFSSLPLLFSLVRLQTFLANDFRKPYERQAIISGHSVSKEDKSFLVEYSECVMHTKIVACIYGLHYSVYIYYFFSQLRRTSRSFIIHVRLLKKVSQDNNDNRHYNINIKKIIIIMINNYNNKYEDNDNNNNKNDNNDNNDYKNSH